MVTGADTSYAGTGLLAVGEHALANYNAWIVRQFVRYFRDSDTTGKAVLDFGAGIGTLSVIFERDSGVRPLAIEVDVNHQVALRNRNIETYASLADLSRPMDFIYSSNVLEHIADDVSTLAALRDRLVAGGKIAIFVPAFESIWTTLDDRVGHHRRYTVAGLEEKLVAAGFEVEFDQVLRLPRLPARVSLPIHWRRLRRAQWHVPETVRPRSVSGKSCRRQGNQPAVRQKRAGTRTTVLRDIPVDTHEASIATVDDFDRQVRRTPACRYPRRRAANGTHPASSASCDEFQRLETSSRTHDEGDQLD